MEAAPYFFFIFLRLIKTFAAAFFPPPPLSPVATQSSFFDDLRASPFFLQFLPVDDPFLRFLFIFCEFFTHWRLFPSV